MRLFKKLDGLVKHYVQRFLFDSKSENPPRRLRFHRMLSLASSVFMRKSFPITYLYALPKCW